MPSQPVEAVLWRDCELEATDVVATIRKKQRQLRCSWDRFAVIYRNHFHRDDIVVELSRYGIPYSIEGMDVLDTSEVRDLLACVGAVVSLADSASLFRVAALPRFRIDPEMLRAGLNAAGRDVPLALVLQKVAGGENVLAKVREVRDEVQRRQLSAHTALRQIARSFNLPETAAVGAVFDFVKAWERKPVTESGSIGELIEYLDYFREARGTIPLTSEPGNAVRLLTAHAAKGLEFDHVCIIRAYSPSFPVTYREPLFEFPRDLRDEMSVGEDEGKKLNDQEERRLFYVAMTRARDSLTLYGKQGKGKDSNPPGFLRELACDSSIATSFTRRNARPMQVDLFAEQAQELPKTNLASWLSLNAITRMTTRLSATAIELYKTCPLQFKLEREWRIPGETPAAMQYGASIHRALRTFCDAVRFGREFSEKDLLEYFRADVQEAKIEDDYQRELYEKQGARQLHDFAESWRKLPVPKILETEKEFKLRIGEASLVGRIDRIDEASGSRVVIIDYKTGKPRSQEDADESLQLSLYAIAARECWGKDSEHLVFYNLETNTTVFTTRSELQLQEAKAEVEGVAEKIVAGRFDPTPGFHCGFCAYRRLCPATEKQLFPATLKKKTAESKVN
jgi:DNA helicase-2/ATP-dependent DNA helicase PcrA